MSKKLEVLQMLREAGDCGVRSDEFYRRFNGRGVARIYDLRHEGHVIEDERDGKYKRYFLRENVGVDAGCSRQQAGESQAASIHSGVEAAVSTSSPPSVDHTEGSARTLNPYEAEVWAD